MEGGGGLELAREQHPSGATVVRVSGEVDLATVSELQQELAASGRAQPLVVDLTECTFLDSSGVRVLLAAAAEADAAGESFALVADEGGVRRALDIAAVPDRVPVHATLAQALEAA
jgi:anti-sigma B factor antagonist